MLTFQEIILRLNAFWEKQGCIIHQGHGLEVGAGTFNPATFLRCLGPEGYKTAYVEPSRRPKDARYGDNPNRVQLFHQYQVIVKPSPPNILQLYLDSLRTLGFDLKKHDIRFVHDDWESPSIGAWGLGWEVWCDGMEITQFTYFQAVGSLPLHPISVEITVGLERLALFIQNKASIFDVQWNEALTFRDIIHRSEVEYSVYNFEEASIGMWLKHFEDYEKEAKRLIGRHLPLPAYDFVLKASHAFNMLEARGAISVTERTGYIARMRDLARLIATEYVDSREKLGFPLLARQKPQKEKKRLAPKATPKFSAAKRRDFLLEIGSEPLPAAFIPMGCRHLEKSVRELLDRAEFAFEDVRTFGAPQRLAILVRGLVEGTAPKETLKRGPAIASAFDAKGHLTAQGQGFFKSMGLEPVTLEALRKSKSLPLFIESVKEIEYLFARLTQPGKSTLMTLAEALPSLIGNLEFPKKMRWGALDVSYARPVHWIVALFGDQIVPFQWGDVLSGRTSYGHLQRGHPRFALKTAKEYTAALKKHCVLVDIDERRASIVKQLKAIEKKIGGVALEQDKVLPQVLHLTEWPVLMHAPFDADFLRAPKEVLISEMVEHQKYFPVADTKGQLKNSFIITADAPANDTIRRGNQKVLSARLADGVFLYEQDLKASLESWNEKLKDMTYQKELGSMYDKVMRLCGIAGQLNRHLGIADEQKVLRAALLSKADLASLLTQEFPELQGTIGKYYALARKEDKEVCTALEEQWMPRFENAPLPKTGVGTILSLADKLDNLIGCYSVGLKPTSSSDPYALRRQTIGLLKILIEAKESLNLKAVLEEACQHFPKLNTSPASLAQEILTFITARAKSVFEDCGFKKDECEAILQGSILDPYDSYQKLEALHTFRHSAGFAKLVEVYKRSKGQLTASSKTPFNPTLLTEPAEKELVTALDVLNKQWKSLLHEKNYSAAFHHIAKLQPPLAKLFDTVKILDDDPAIRDNRIALLQKVFAPFQELLDFSKLQ